MKWFALALLSVLILIPESGKAQPNDCAEAFVVCSNENLTFNPHGPGMDDYADPDNEPGCITSLEQNSAWYYFQIDPNAPPGLELGFIISPNGGLGEDYDWALYGPDVTCGNLGFPIRCSSSSAQCGFCPETGLGMGTTDVTEGPGTGDGFVMTLPVEPGQGYYLMIDNWLGTTNGFEMTWTESAAPYLNCDAQPPCALEAIAGPDINACEGDEDIPLNGSSNGNHGNETYSWSGSGGGTVYLSDPEIANPTVTLPPGFTGVIRYTLTVMEDTCVSTDDMELFINPLPTVNIPQIGPFCPSDPAATLTALPPGGTWSGDNTGNTFNPMTNGPGIHTVFYTYTDANGCTTVEPMDIEVHDPPDVSIDPDPAEFCDSEGSVLLTATGSGGAGGYEYTWNTPTGTDDGNTYDATISGPHTVTVTDANGCRNTSVVIVTAYENPDVYILDPGPLCESTEFFTLTAVPPGGVFDGTIVSPDGDINPNLENPGVYPITYTYTDNHNCEGSITENITIIPVPEAIPDNNGPLCAGQQIILMGQTNGSGATVAYHWEGPNSYSSDLQNPTNATEGGTYTLQVTIDGCPSEVAVTTVVVHDLPEAFASNNGPYCTGQTIQLLGTTNATGTNITYAWSGPGGFTSDVQNPTNATLPGTYTLIVSVDACSSQPATTDVIFNAPPNGVATNTGPYCAGETIQLNGSTSTTGTVISYAWNGPNGYTSSVQNPTDASAPGLYTLVVTVDGCNSPNSNTSVIINNLPQPVITGQASFCTGFSSILDAGAGYASYAWSDASVNQTLEVFASGTYNVTVTDINGCTGQASFAVTETASLTPVITGVLSFCEGSGTTLDAGAGFAGYTWSTGETTQTINVTDEGNFGVLVIDADGCTGSANITTTINPNPTVTIGGSTTYCIGGFTILDAGTGYTSYTWSNSSTSQTITVSSPGTYSVDVIDTNGCAGSGSVAITESTSLSPVITGSNAFCENGTTTLNAGSGFNTYLWSDGSMNQNLVVSTAGIYAVTVSDTQGCSGETSVAVTEVLPPAAVVSPDTSLCNTTAGGSILNLYDLIYSGDMNGSWADADQSGAVGLFDNLNFNNITAGDYRFIYTTNSAIDPCPETTYEVVVTVIDCSCPDVFFHHADPLCNTSDVLDLTTIENTTEPGTWSLIQTPAGSNPATLVGTLFNATSSDPGQYTLQFDLQNQPPPGCPLDFQVTVDVDPSVEAGTAAAPVAYCYKDSELVDLSSLLTGADANGLWSETSPTLSQGNAFLATNATFQTDNQLPGTYTFQYGFISGGACPDDSAEVAIVIKPLPDATIVDFGILDCVNTTQSLDASGSSSGPDYDIEWEGPGILNDGNENTLNPTIDEPGDYILNITNTMTGCIESDTVTVIENTAAPTDALIISEDPSCFGDVDAFININQVIGGTPPYLYSLNNAAFTANNVYPNLSAGSYDIALQDASGCQWDTTIVLVEPSAITIDVGPDIELGLGESAEVEALIQLGNSPMDTLIWSPPGIIECYDALCLEGIIHAANSGTLSATVYDENGCKETDNLVITVDKDRKIYFANVFSPDGDGINDVFFVQGNDGQIVLIKKLMIFNRWGETIFEMTDILPNDPTKGWDGRFRDELMNPGVFAYYAEVTFIDGIDLVYVGDVTIVR
jgi:gliding motility-associated-like protein